MADEERLEEIKEINGKANQAYYKKHLKLSESKSKELTPKNEKGTIT